MAHRKWNFIYWIKISWTIVNVYLAMDATVSTCYLWKHEYKTVCYMLVCSMVWYLLFMEVVVHAKVYECMKILQLNLRQSRFSSPALMKENQQFPITLYQDRILSVAMSHISSFNQPPELYIYHDIGSSCCPRLNKFTAIRDVKVKSNGL